MRKAVLREKDVYETLQRRKTMQQNNTTSSKSSSWILVILGVIAIGYFIRSQSDKNESSHSSASGMHTSEPPAPAEFNGYECTVDCSGHEAGFKWAEEHEITDGDDCDTAGERSNSPSFAEGCHSYVDGDSDPETHEGDSARDPDGDSEN
jgi:hypothetical protein